jgi:hypothetical protein
MPLITTHSARGYGFGSLVAPSENDYEAIATYTVTGSATANITFSSIPSTYKHLQVRGILRSDRSGYVQTGCSFRFNGDSGSNYNWNQSYSSSSSVPASETYGNESALRLGELPAANANANTFGFILLNIFDYTSTNKYKTTHEVGGSDRNGSSFLGINHGNWRSTSAVTSITLLETAANWVVGSKLSLYGIRG